MDARPAPIASFDTPTQPAAPALALEMPLQRRGGSAWRQIARTLGWRPAARANAATLGAARESCLASLADLPLPDVRALRNLLRHACSLAELWHLRPEVYRVLALHHSQAVAERRLAALNRVFDAAAASPNGTVATPI
jgi:hypothetical protein